MSDGRHDNVGPGLGRTGEWSRSAFAIVAAFGTYFCMYGFRKPFTFGKYDDTTLWGIDYKTVLVTAQVLGYTLSKFLGIKVVAEIKPARRALLLLGLVGIAEAALLLFGLTPAPFNFVWLFLNGLPLGMVFGLVLGFLEGRRQTEALTAGLCTSFIVADGVMKSVGGYLCEAGGLTEYWMPFTAGLLFLPFLCFFVWMLTRIPAPSHRDVAARGERQPMDGADRRRLYSAHGLGLTLLLIVFGLITILRSVRADFAPEIWRGLAVDVDPGVFTLSEAAVGLGVLVVCGSVVFLRDNRQAFFSALGLAIFGTILVGLALIGLQAGWLTPFAFMVLHGLGLYLPYIVVHTTIFERLMAMTRDRGTIGYLMCLADAFGYLGYVGVLLAGNFLRTNQDMLPFFERLSWGIALTCLVLLIPCWRYFVMQSAVPPEIAPASENVIVLADIERTA